jgi:hypothetical protein
MTAMKDEPGNDHLTPELLVDLLEGTPVAADRRQHLDGCVLCREELSEISATLARLKSADRREAIGPAPSRSSVPSRLRRWAPWLSAAALLLLALFLVREPDEREVAVPAEAEALLPSVDEDADFQILRTLSEELGEEALIDEVYDFGTIPADVLELTPAERRNLLGRLADEMTRS